MRGLLKRRDFGIFRRWWKIARSLIDPMRSLQRC